MKVERPVVQGLAGGNVSCRDSARKRREKEGKKSVEDGRGRDRDFETRSRDSMVCKSVIVRALGSRYDTQAGCQRVTATEMADQVERVPLRRVCARAATTTTTVCRARPKISLSLSLPRIGFARKSNESLPLSPPRV